MAVIVVAVELAIISYVRHRFMWWGVGVFDWDFDWELLRGVDPCAGITPGIESSLSFEDWRTADSGFCAP